MYKASNGIHTIIFEDIYLNDFIKRVCSDEDVIAHLDEFTEDAFYIELPYIGSYSVGGAIYAITHQEGEIRKEWVDAKQEYCDYIEDYISETIEYEGKTEYKDYKIVHI